MSEKSALDRATEFLKEVKKVDLDHFVPSMEQAFRWPSIPTGNIKLDYLIGEFGYCPGIPRGGITNVFGPEHSGKTSFCLHACASVIEQGGCVCYIDYENILDTRYAKKLGIPVEDKSKFALYQPQTLEQGVISLLVLLEQGVDLIVYDSVGAAIPKAVLEMTVEDIEAGKTGGIGLSARKWSEYLPRIQQMLKNSNSSLIAVSQTRSGINAGYGAEETTQGGKGWKFFSILRIELRPSTKIYKEGSMNILDGKKGREFIGNKVRVTVKKCKVAPTQNRYVHIDVLPNKGFDPVRSLVDFAKNLKIIKQSGSWFSYERTGGESVKWPGFEKMCLEIESNKEMKDEIFGRVVLKVVEMSNGKDGLGTVSIIQEDDGNSEQEVLEVDCDEDGEEIEELKSKKTPKKGKKLSKEDSLIEGLVKK